jgi:HD-like signal output (HDOD) protein
MVEFPELSEDLIKRRIEGAPRLASLRNISMALSELVYAENSFTSQIAEIIRRDPSLTSRLLKLVNSVFFGLSQRVNDIEEAIFYLGLRQIRQLALATPIIEDFEKLHGDFKSVDWYQLWRHSIGSGILTREILSVAGISFEDDTDYIIGLIHNVGKIVSAGVFPDRFVAILAEPADDTLAVCRLEEQYIGWDHARVGAYFLERHRLGPEIVEPVRYHNNPSAAPDFPETAAAVQIADHMVRSENVDIQGIEGTPPVPEDSWKKLEGWDILFGAMDAAAEEAAVKSLATSLQRLPKVLKSMI